MHFLITHQTIFFLKDSRASDNLGSGIHFNPYLTREQQRELTGWMKLRSGEFFHVNQLSPQRTTIEKDRYVVLITDNLRDTPNTKLSFTFQVRKCFNCNHVSFLTIVFM